MATLKVLVIDHFFHQGLQLDLWLAGTPLLRFAANLIMNGAGLNALVALHPCATLPRNSRHLAGLSIMSSKGPNSDANYIYIYIYISSISDC